MEKLAEKYVWEVPVRATHWVNFFSILTLAATGLFIGSPRNLAQETSQYVMGWVRFIHFVAAYVFAISVVSRIYWMFRGNRYASWREFFPFLTAEGRRNMSAIFRYYLFMSRKVPHPVGHNALAGITYLVVFVLYLVMIVTGFALYAQYAPGSVMYGATGWLFVLFSSQGLRLTHHLVMWFLLAFAIHHVYSAWLMDIKEKGRVMSSIFSGYKVVKARK